MRTTTVTIRVDDALRTLEAFGLQYDRTMKRRLSTIQTRRAAEKRADIVWGLAMGIPAGLFLTALILAHGLLLYGHFPI
jgi:hypothetical protein